jgi:hypothetical protein
MSGAASRVRWLLPKALLALAALALAGVLIGLWSGPADAATTFTVNKTGDAGDLNISDDMCDTSSKSGNQCTLRAAIEEANNTPGADTINFAIGGRATVKTIEPRSGLPAITDTVTIDGYSQPGASANTLATANDAILKIQLSGKKAGEFVDGLRIFASNSTIRGLVINGFDGRGILVQGFGTTGNKIEGNFIGTDAKGTKDVGNDSDGVFIQGAEDTTVGGTASGTRNVISGNNGSGVFIFGSTSGTRVEGNRIGSKADGTGEMGNSSDGVFIQSAEDTTIGGTASGAGNLIAHNSRAGVSVFGSGGVGNSVLSNFIFSNGGTSATNLGIDLGASGVTNNDTDDTDTGANNLQNFPVITSAIRSNTTGLTTIRGTLNSNPNQSFTIQCFVAVPDTSGHGEGQIPVASDTTVTTDAGGDADGPDSFSCVSPIPQAGQAMTATATNTATGDTSEFSLNVGVTPGP